MQRNDALLAFLLCDALGLPWSPIADFVSGMETGADPSEGANAATVLDDIAIGRWPFEPTEDSPWREFSMRLGYRVHGPDSFPGRWRVACSVASIVRDDEMPDGWTRSQILGLDAFGSASALAFAYAVNVERATWRAGEVLGLLAHLHQRMTIAELVEVGRKTVAAQAATRSRRWRLLMDHMLDAAVHAHKLAPKAVEGRPVKEVIDRAHPVLVAMLRRLCEPFSGDYILRRRAGEEPRDVVHGMVDHWPKDGRWCVVSAHDQIRQGYLQDGHDYELQALWEPLAGYWEDSGSDKGYKPPPDKWNHENGPFPPFLHPLGKDQDYRDLDGAPCVELRQPVHGVACRRLLGIALPCPVWPEDMPWSWGAVQMLQATEDRVAEPAHDRRPWRTRDEDEAVEPDSEELEPVQEEPEAPNPQAEAARLAREAEESEAKAWARKMYPLFRAYMNMGDERADAFLAAIRAVEAAPLDRLDHVAATFEAMAEDFAGGAR